MNHKKALRLVALATFLAATPAFGAQPVPSAGPATPAPPAATPERIDVIPLDKGAYVIGGVHNVGLILGPRGALLVDSRMAGDFAVLSRRIATVTKQPVKYVVSTHYHPDHVGSNDLFRRAGAEIVGQSNLARRMLAPPEPNPYTGKPLDPAPVDVLPTITYSERMAIDLGGGIEVQLVHKNAHTDDDTIVLVPARNVIFAGDIVMMAYSPPDLTSGGSIDGLIDATDFIIRNSNQDTRIVPGHFRTMSQADVIAFHTMLITARDRIARAKAQGMTEDQVVAAHLLADLDKDWMGPGPVIATFPRVVYRSVP